MIWASAGVLACVALGVGAETAGALAGRLTELWRPEMLGVLLATTVGLASWATTPRGRSKENAELTPAREDLVRRQTSLRDRLGRGLVEACEQRQYHLRQHLEVGLVRQLAGLRLLAGKLEQRLATGNRPEAAEAAKIMDLVERTISEARMLAASAHPPEIETEGLEVTLRKLAEAAEKYHVYCRVVEDSCCPKAAGSTSLQLYRVVQLIVERAIRHGKPHHILVELTAGPEKYMSMTVTDRVGQGDRLPELTETEVCDLQARVRSVSGTLQIEQPAGGLRLNCRMMAKGPKLQD